MKKLLYLSLVTLLITASCNSKSENQSAEPTQKIENCIYSYNEVTTQLDWTAYKFLRKAGVGGTFKKINVDGVLQGADPKVIVESLNFSIPVNTVETNDPGRNEKIAKFFFGSLEGTDLLTGRVKSLGDNSKALLEINMNGITQNVEGDYTLVDNVFTFKTEIDVMNWNAELGIARLNEECKDLHTDVENGDTESKLWSDVSINFKMELSKKCD
jgi:hypothetical protein